MNQGTDIQKIDKNVQWDMGQRIQKARMKRGLSGADIGAYLDISTNQVSRIENGRAKCTLEHIFILTQLLECSADYLLFGIELQPNFSPAQVQCINALIASFS